MPVWIQLPNLLLHLWSPDLIGKIASVVGKPLYLDNISANSSKIRFVRVCVEISADKTPPSSVQVEVEDSSDLPYLQEIEYESTFKLCTSCKVFGHIDGDCLKSQSTFSTISSKKSQAKKLSHASHDPGRTLSRNVQPEKEWTLVQRKKNYIKKDPVARQNLVLETERSEISRDAINLDSVPESALIDVISPDSAELVSCMLTGNQSFVGTHSDSEFTVLEPPQSLLVSDKVIEDGVGLQKGGSAVASAGLHVSVPATPNRIESETASLKTATSNGLFHVDSTLSCLASSTIGADTPACDHVEEDFIATAAANQPLGPIVDADRSMPTDPCSDIPVSTESASCLPKPKSVVGNDNLLFRQCNHPVEANSFDSFSPGVTNHHDVVPHQLPMLAKSSSPYLQPTPPIGKTQTQTSSNPNPSPTLSQPLQSTLNPFNLDSSFFNLDSPSRPTQISNLNPSLTLQTYTQSQPLSKPQSTISPKPPSTTLSSIHAPAQTKPNPDISQAKDQLSSLLNLSPISVHPKSIQTTPILAESSDDCSEDESMSFPLGFTPDKEDMLVLRELMKEGVSMVPPEHQSEFVESVDRAEDGEILEFFQEKFKKTSQNVPDTNYLTHKNVRCSPRIRKKTARLNDSTSMSGLKKGFIK